MKLNKKITNCEEPGSNHESPANALEAVKKNTHTHTHTHEHK
jgi:hypothetical protein